MPKSKSIGNREKYRVVGVGGSYLDPTEFTADDNSTTTLGVRRELPATGETVELVASEGKRLSELGVVVPADAPATYSEMVVDELQAEADRRGLTVEGTGAHDRVLREDLIAALNAADAAAA